MQNHIEGKEIPSTWVSPVLLLRQNNISSAQSSVAESQYVNIILFQQQIARPSQEEKVEEKVEEEKAEKTEKREEEKKDEEEKDEKEESK